MNSTQLTHKGAGVGSAQEDVRDAWVLRAGAELWKVVVQEADRPAADTQKALRAVRDALDCARCLRRAGRATEMEREALAREADAAWIRQFHALQEWGQNRGLNWGTEWGTQWGESLRTAESPANASAI